MLRMRINLMVIVLDRLQVHDLKDTQGVNWSWQSPKPRPHSDRQGDPGWSCDQCHLSGPLERCGGESCASVSHHCNGRCHFCSLMCHSCLSWILRVSCFEKPRLHSLPHTQRCKQPLTCPGWFHCSCFSSLQEDRVSYYTWRTFGPHDQRTRELWVDMSDVRRANVRVHGILSNSYKQAVVSFDWNIYCTCVFWCGEHIFTHFQIVSVVPEQSQNRPFPLYDNKQQKSSAIESHIASKWWECVFSR